MSSSDVEISNERCFEEKPKIVQKCHNDPCTYFQAPKFEIECFDHPDTKCQRVKDLGLCSDINLKVYYPLKFKLYLIAKVINE